MCVYVLEEGWGRGGAYELDGDGGGGAGGLGFHGMGSRCQDRQVALALLAGPRSDSDYQPTRAE